MTVELYAGKTQSHVVAVALLGYKSLALRAPRREASDGHPKKQTYKEKRSMKALVARFVREDSGQDLIEYGLLVGIITAGAVSAINLIGPKVTTYYSTLQSRIP
jgi:Flp pilus assembly pilin Flp